MLDPSPPELPSLPFGETPWQKKVSLLQKFKILPRFEPGSHPILRSLSLLAVTLVFLALSGLGYYLHELGIFQGHRGQFAAILQWKPADNTLILDRNEQKIAEIFSSYHIYTPLSEAPPALLQAILAIEDRTFWSHPGVDLRGMLRALKVYVAQEKTSFSQGASTITQQLVRHFLLPKEKTLSRKIKEIFLALELEQLVDKNKILEIYINSLFLGDGAYGVGAAAKRFFDKPLKDLATHELAVIAGLFQSPSRYNPHRFPKKAKDRQLLVLKAMAVCGFISRDQARSLAKQSLHYQPYRSLYASQAPYFIDYVTEEAQTALGTRSIKNQGLRIITSLDLQLQDLAEKVIDRQAPLLDYFAAKTPQGDNKNPVPIEAALLATDPKNGDILAMVGGRDYQTSQFNRTVHAHRQPGSAFKPVVYSLALQEHYRWSDVIYVTPITLAGNYRPRTPTSDYLTQTTLLRAFYRSMNAPSLELGEKLGLKPVLEHAQKLGFTSDLKMEFGSILGASEATMFDLARMNGTFANLGVRVQLRGILEIQDKNGKVLYQSPSLVQRSQQVLSAPLAYMMVSGMQEVLQRGTARSSHELGSIAAGKTGTSNLSKDNWFTGYTPNLVAISWVGSDDFRPMAKSAQSSNTALPIWTDFVSSAQALRPSPRFHPPAGVTALRIDPDNGQRSSHGVKMWFLPEALPRGSKLPEGTLSNVRSFRNPLVQ